MKNELRSMTTPLDFYCHGRPPVADEVAELTLEELEGLHKRIGALITMKRMIASARTNCCKYCFITGEECDPITAPHMWSGTTKISA